MIGLILFATTLVQCVEDKKHIEPHKRHFPNNEVEQEITDEKAEALHLLALDAYDRKDYNESINLLKASLLIEKNPIVYNELGVVNSTIKNYDVALEYHRTGQEIDSTFWLNFINESNVYLRLNEFKKAQPALEHVSNNSKSKYWKSYAYFYLAITYYSDGRQCTKAIEYLDKSESLKNDPELKQVYLKFDEIMRHYCS